MNGPAGTVKHDAIESSGEAIHLKMIKCRSSLLYIEGFYRSSVPLVEVVFFGGELQMAGTESWLDLYLGYECADRL